MTSFAMRVEDIHTYYGNSYILQGLSLAIAAGETVAVLGRNGVGKTTLMHLVPGRALFPVSCCARRSRLRGFRR
jgi:ABC-type branched-subunit amino acid transport system ATPase component